MMKKLMVSLVILEAALMGILMLIMSCNREKGEMPADDQTPLITMEKTVCFGTCPVYQIRIYNNGLAEYSGEMHVRKIGQYRRQLPSETISELIRSFERADFYALKDEYVADVTDLPTTYLTFQHNGKFKKVKDLIDAPQQLIDLENQVAAIAESPDWVKVAD